MRLGNKTTFLRYLEEGQEFFVGGMRYVLVKHFKGWDVAVVQDCAAYRPMFMGASMEVEYDPNSVDDITEEEWNEYIRYLHKWAVDHSDRGRAGGSPMSHTEWRNQVVTEDEVEF